MAQTDIDKDMEVFEKALAILGTALHNGQIDVKWYKSKTGQAKSSKFTIYLDGTDGAIFMGAIFAGTVFAGIIPTEELITKLEKAEQLPCDRADQTQI